MLVLIAAATGVTTRFLTCSECNIVQEAIHRAVVANITSIGKEEKRKHVERIEQSTVRAVIDLGGIIAGMCTSSSWKARHHHDLLNMVCERNVKVYHFEYGEVWRKASIMPKYAKKFNIDHTALLTDPDFALRMKLATCFEGGDGGVKVTESSSEGKKVEVARLELREPCPRLMRPAEDWAAGGSGGRSDSAARDTWPDECAMCQAIVRDSFVVVRSSSLRPTRAQDSRRDVLAGLLGTVCDEIGLRRPVARDRRDAVSEACTEMWDEHEDDFLELATRRDAQFATGLCSTRLGICDQDMAEGALYAPFGVHEPPSYMDDETRLRVEADPAWSLTARKVHQDPPAPAEEAEAISAGATGASATHGDKDEM